MKTIHSVKKDFIFDHKASYSQCHASTIVELKDTGDYFRHGFEVRMKMHPMYAFIFHIIIMAYEVSLNLLPMVR